MSTNDAVEYLEQFLGNDDGELSWQVCEAIGEVLERLRAVEADAGRYRKMRSIIQAEHPEVTDEQYDRDFDCEMSSEGVTK